MPNRIGQVEVIVFRIINNEPQILLLKRIPERGGFWEPITGGINPGEEIPSAALREVFEETGIENYIDLFKDIHYFEFESPSHGRLKEYVYALHVDPAQEITISKEHSEMMWCSTTEALELLKYDSNKEGVRILIHTLNLNE